MYKDHYTASYALVIGIDNYKDSRIPPLFAAENDAQQVAEVLSTAPYEFDVTLLLGERATRSAVTTALEDLYEVEPNARIIFYFAGHGYKRKDRYGIETGYLQVYDSRMGRDTTALRMSDMTELGRRSDAKHIAFIIDACSSALMLTAIRGDEPEVAVDKLMFSEARHVLSAAVEGAADHPSMTTFLLSALKNDSVNPKTGLYIFDDLGHDVLNDVIASPNPAHRLQKPVYGLLPGTGSQGGGQFIFRHKKEIILDPNLKTLLNLLHSPFEGVRQGALHDLLTELDHPEHGVSYLQALEANKDNNHYPRILEVLETHHQRQVENALFEIHEMTELENWQKAREALAMLMQLDPTHSDLQSLGQAIDTGEHEQYIQSLINEIEQRTQAGHFIKAREYLGELESAAPDYPDLSNLARHIDQREIGIKVRQAQHHIADGNFLAAERVIDRILELDPDHSEACALRNEIGRQRNILVLCSEIREGIIDEDWNSAQQKLNQLKQIAPEYSGLNKFEQVIEAGERAEQERIEHERIEIERAKQERLEQERAEKERLQQEHAKQKRLEQERIQKIQRYIEQQIDRQNWAAVNKWMKELAKVKSARNVLRDLKARIARKLPSLSPWNPLDHLELLRIVFFDSAQFKAYKENKRQQKFDITIWLASAIVWLLLFIPALGFSLWTSLADVLPAELPLLLLWQPPIIVGLGFALTVLSETLLSLERHVTESRVARTVGTVADIMALVAAFIIAAGVAVILAFTVVEGDGYTIGNLLVIVGIIVALAVANFVAGGGTRDMMPVMGTNMAGGVSFIAAFTISLITPITVSIVVILDAVGSPLPIIALLIIELIVVAFFVLATLVAVATIFDKAPNTGWGLALRIVLFTLFLSAYIALSWISLMGVFA